MGGGVDLAAHNVHIAPNYVEQWNLNGDATEHGETVRPRYYYLDLRVRQASVCKLRSRNILQSG